MGNEDARSTGSLKRGLLLLNALRAGGEMNVAQLALHTGIPRPTIYRVLVVLEAEHYVQRLSDGSHFATTLPEHVADDSDHALVRQLVPVMRRIAERTGNAVFLGTSARDDLLVLHREIGTYPVQILSLPIGGLQPLGVGAAGVALLSTLPSRQLTSILNRNREAYRKYQNLTDSLVRRLVENCQARGYAVVGDYALKGVLALGMLIQAPSLRRCAVSVTAPIDRMPLPVQREVAKIMRAELQKGGWAPE